MEWEDFAYPLDYFWEGLFRLKTFIFPVCFWEMIPAISRNVDFPEPDFPIIATISLSFRVGEIWELILRC